MEVSSWERLLRSLPMLEQDFVASPYVACYGSFRWQSLKSGRPILTQLSSGTPPVLGQIQSEPVCSKLPQTLFWPWFTKPYTEFATPTKAGAGSLEIKLAAPSPRYNSASSRFSGSALSICYKSEIGGASVILSIASSTPRPRCNG